MNYDSSYRSKTNEDSGEEETQSKDSHKVEKDLLVSRIFAAYFYLVLLANLDLEVLYKSLFFFLCIAFYRNKSSRAQIAICICIMV